ncbi:MAG TPA: MerR family transcriptional regulator [Clostridia bacterium]|nr:MerR family transcriptional regulator [Clostridia bacterium]
MEENRYRISELAEKAGVSKRTIHYYMGRGLLPPSEGAGLGTTYSDEHLYRIILVKKLQDAYLPLDEIRKRISGMTLEEVLDSLKANGQAMALSDPPAEYGVFRERAAEDMHEGDRPGKRIEDKSIAYTRIYIGSGLELHFQSDNEKAREMAEVLYKYAQKMMKEG